ncbi:MAG: hypothetical protein ABIP79_11670 [Chitinophagaceae bacterium]
MDSNIVNKQLLTVRIRQLEQEYENHLDDLKESYHGLLETLKPANIVGAALRSVITRPGLKTTIIDTVISAGAGMLGKKIVVRNSGNIFRKMAGLATQFFLTNLVRNKIPDIKSHSNGEEKYE